jgi:hypothetical protein
MNERIKQLAEQAWGKDHEIFWFDDDGVKRFAELVRQDEREECARLCFDIADRIMFDNVTGSDGAGYCFHEIRARGNTRTKTSRDICGND